MKIESKVKNYQVEFITEVLTRKNEIIDRLGMPFHNLFFFIDKNVNDLYYPRIRNFVEEDKCLLIPAEEENKEYSKLEEYFEWLIENHFTRNDVLVTIGGGVLQDISGFIASTLYRGIKWVFIPTTLLAQGDSCIGSKTSVNFKGSKNLIGSFYPPDIIFIDINFCKTLSSRYFNSGIGEIIKFHLLSDQKGYSLLLNYLNSDDIIHNTRFEQIVYSTLRIKHSYFADDEYDTGRRNLLNYGHCFGHALESATNFQVCHGEAVIVGMGFANLVALNRSVLTYEKYEEVEAILRKYYPLFDFFNITPGEIVHYLKRDKKRVGKDLTLILLSDIGSAYKYDDIKENEIKKAFEIFFDRYPQK